MTVAVNDLLRVTGGEQHPQVGTRVAEPASQLRAAHAGHHDVCQEQIERLRAGLGGDDRLARVGGRGDVEACAHENAGGDLAQDRLVLDEENSTRPPGHRKRRLLVDRHFALHAREEEPERCSTSWCGVDQDRALGLLDDAVRRGQAEPGSAPLALGREERLEDVVARLRVHAQAGVGDRDDRVLAGADLARPRAVPGRVPLVRSADYELAAGRHGVPAVQCKVQDDLLQLGPVRSQAAGRRIRGDPELDLLAD